MSRKDLNPVSFDGNEFDGEQFSVDEWVQRKRFTVPLDVLRDDLGIHLKHLRSSLIELINQDYNQFVALSSSLVGLDGKIQNIVGPLTKAEKDVQALNGNIGQALESIECELDDIRRIRSKRAELRSLKVINASIQSSASYVQEIPDNIERYEDFESVSLASDEICTAKFLLSKCSDTAVKRGLQAKFDEVCGTFFGKLSTYLQIYSGLSSLSEVEEAVLKSILRVYGDLGAEAQAEQVFEEHIVKPLCMTVLTKKGNVNALLDEVEEFMGFCPVVKLNQNLEESPWMAEYDFVGRVIFPTIVTVLTKHFPHTWSPAIPDVFHANWRRCENFISVIESRLPSLSHFQRFTESQGFKDFVSKWQFPVYFQLRFHTLAIELESALDSVDAPSASPEFKLDATRCTVKVIKQCWDPEKVYLSYLGGRFLKASALFTARYLSAVTSDLIEKKSASEDILVNLYWDIKFLELVFGQILIEQIITVVHFGSSEERDETCQTFLKGFQWESTCKKIEERLVSSIVEKSVNCMNSVLEVPRLFRRTNREMPSKPNDYVDATFAPFESLKTLCEQSKVSELWANVSADAGSKLAASYQTQLNEVLTSVARMEESLKRLKKAKGQNVSATGETKTLTDDDKIRLQLGLDMDYFVLKVRKLCPSVNIESLSKLRATTGK